MKAKGPIVNKSFELGVLIIKLYQELNERHLWDIARQVLRSGTSVGANVNEAQAAESTKDFIHKLSISLKESKELSYWLELLIASNILEEKDIKEIIDLNNELHKMISSAILTSKKKL